MYKISENRKYKRIEKPYITRFRIKPYKTQDINSKDWDMVAVNNLGAGGIFFYARRDFGIGTALDLKIGFSKTNPCIKCVGRVVRATRHFDTIVFGIAIEFTEINKQIKKILDKTALFVNPEIQFHRELIHLN
jgi:hypothetical protein